MTLRARLTLGFLAIVVLLTIPLAISVQALIAVRTSVTQLQQGDFTASQVLGRAVRGLAEVRAEELAYTTFEDSIAGPPLRQAVDSLAAIADSLETFGRDEARTAASLRAALDTVRTVVPIMRSLVDSGLAGRADTLSFERVRPALDRAERELNLLGGALDRGSAGIAEEAAERAAGASELTMSAFGLSLALAGIIAFAITRSISRPVRELDTGMQAVAEGDFRRPIRIHAHRDDEFGRLARSYELMARRLAELDKLKAEFVSIASHELKTPINVILGYLQLLEEGLYGPLTPRQKEVLATLAAQGQSLARLVQQLLDISRFEAGGGRLELRDVALAGFVNELETAFHVLALQRDIRFHVLVGEGMPKHAVWDADRMNEVLGNLLSNAFKFTERGGRVDLEVTRSDGGVRFIVRDTGAGIAPSQLPHVFRKFYQADNQAAASLKGSGLGLAIAKEIVEAHGGTIAVDSTPGVGTTFLIELPIRARVRRVGGVPATAAGVAR